MSLSCTCGGVGDEFAWYYFEPKNYQPLTTRRRKRCCSCNDLIEIGALCTEFKRHRLANSEIEERIYGEGEEIHLASHYHCEQCADLYFSLSELGFCNLLGDSMQELLEEYHEVYGLKQERKST
jgi:hypothetical protein